MSVLTQEPLQNTSWHPFLGLGVNEELKTGIETKTLVSSDEFELLSNEIEEIQNGENQNGNSSQTGLELFYNQIEVSQANKTFPLKTIQSDFDFKIGFSDFNCNFNLEIVDIHWSLSSNEIVLYLDLDGKLTVKAILDGYWKEGTEPTFQLESFGMKLDKKQETPISMFLSSTLWAMLGLSPKFRVRIPQLNYDLTTSFELSVNEVSKLLQERQIAYRLLVIESATGIKLPFPQGYIHGEDIGNIAFCYHAIVDREFDWFLNPTTIPWTANEESFSWLPETDKPTSLIFGPEVFLESIFGVEIPLGVLTAKIEKADIDNYEEVRENLSKLDNSIVEVKLRSLNGMNRIIAVRVPTLTPNPWSLELQKLIDLDGKLDSIVLDKYFALAALTLEGLTEEQKEAILERPNLDEDAFDF